MLCVLCVKLDMLHVGTQPAILCSFSMEAGYARNNIYSHGYTSGKFGTWSVNSRYLIFRLQLCDILMDGFHVNISMVYVGECPPSDSLKFSMPRQ